MKNHTIQLVVVMILAALAGAVLAGRLNAVHRALRPERSEMSNLPIGGMHKFAADVEWMLFVNYVGSQNEINESNVDEVISRLNRLIALDPNLDRLYCEGVTMIAFADPERTVEMLKKACENPHLRNNAQIPFYTGFVMIHNLKPARYEDAVAYFQMAVARCQGEESQWPQYLSYLLRARAHALAKSENIDLHLALVEVLYKEIRDGRAGNADPGNLRARLLEAVRRIRQPDEEYTPTKKVLDRVSHIVRRVFGDLGVCGECMTPIGPGQSFCASCGAKVECWGTCGKCKQVIAHASFCPFCGTRNSGGKK